MKLVSFECDGCEESIENPEEMVKVEVDNIPEGVGKKRHYHLECWEGLE